MSGLPGAPRRFYDVVNRVFEPLYRFSGAIAGLAFVAALVTLPWYAETAGAVDLPVYSPGGAYAVAGFWLSGAVFAVFVAIETVTGLVANVTAFGRWVLDRMGVE
jgi:hypothetical protein